MSDHENGISIYLHWPFCLSKCPYCDFSSIPVARDTELFATFGDLLFRDLQQTLSMHGTDHTIDTVFFGGGTPSLMSERSIENILNFLSVNYAFNADIEISMEANPATFDLVAMRAFQDAGINRISLGIQSFSDDNLRFLGRSYDSRAAFVAAETVAKVFDNYNFDFMYGYKYQTIESIKNDLERAVEFECRHVSAYQLTFEEGTPFYDKLMRGSIKAFPEKKTIVFYEFIGDFLRNHGIDRYEVSNYAKKGFECRHNLNYWNYGEYLGVGPAAHGRIHIGEKKYATEKIVDPFAWAKAIENGANTYSLYNELTEREALEEQILMGLRMINGMTFDKTKYQPNIVDILTEKALFLHDKKLAEVENSSRHLFIRLTNDGTMKMNSVVELLCENL